MRERRRDIRVYVTLLIVWVLTTAGCSPFDNCDVVRTAAECRAKCVEHGARMDWFSFDPTSTGSDCWRYSCSCSIGQ